LKERDVEIRGRDKQIEELKDEVHRRRLAETQLEHRLREARERLTEIEERVKYYN
jgi:hypothetical protein